MIVHEDECFTLFRLWNSIFKPLKQQKHVLSSKNPFIYSTEVEQRWLFWVTGNLFFFFFLTSSNWCDRCSQLFQLRCFIHAQHRLTDVHNNQWFSAHVALDCSHLAPWSQLTPGSGWNSATVNIMINLLAAWKRCFNDQFCFIQTLKKKSWDLSTQRHYSWLQSIIGMCEGVKNRADPHLWSGHVQVIVFSNVIAQYPIWNIRLQKITPKRQLQSSPCFVQSDIANGVWM